MSRQILLTKMTGREAVVSAIADMRDASRSCPTPRDGVLADKLAQLLEQKAESYDHTAVVKRVGQACHFPCGLLNSCSLIAQLGDDQKALVDGVQRNIIAGLLSIPYASHCFTQAVAMPAAISSWALYRLRAPVIGTTFRHDGARSTCT